MGVCLGIEESANRLVERGEEALDRRDLMAARDLFAKAIDLFPVTKLVDAQLGVARRGTRRFVVTPLSKPGTAQGEGGRGTPSASEGATEIAMTFANPGPKADGADDHSHSRNPLEAVVDSRRASTLAGIGLGELNPADKATVRQLIAHLEVRMRIAQAYMNRKFWSLAEEQVTIVNSITGPLHPHLNSYIMAQRVLHLHEDSCVGLARIAVAEAKACNGVQPTYDHMCRLAAFHCGRAKDTIMEEGSVVKNARMIDILLIEKELHQIRGEHKSALAAFQRCVGIVTACKGIQYEARQELLEELQELKIRAAQEDVATDDLTVISHNM